MGEVRRCIKCKGRIFYDLSDSLPVCPNCGKIDPKATYFTGRHSQQKLGHKAKEVAKRRAHRKALKGKRG